MLRDVLLLKLHTRTQKRLRMRVLEYGLGSCTISHDSASDQRSGQGLGLQPFFVLHLSALPIRFKRELKNEEGTESGTATLQCELSQAGGSLEWRKDGKVLVPSSKYKMRQEGRFVELVIQELDLTDAGSYTCVCGDQTTTAALTVNGNHSPPLTH